MELIGNCARCEGKNWEMGQRVFWLKQLSELRCLELR